jgi:bifunctional DNA-binding transcriptional regulator/antitoxin component of YhaV-PrlF toxin-antitoxin module
VREVSKYIATGSREIIKTTTLYSDGKTQVPKKVIEKLRLSRGSQIVWVIEGGRIYVESPSI